MKGKAVYLIILISSAVALMATSYSGPVKQKVFSGNGKFFAVIDPEVDVQKVYRDSDHAKVYWSFAFRPEADSWFVSDNGYYVVCIRWRFVRADDLDEPAVIIFSRKNGRTDYSYNSLVKARKTGFFETAPRGSFWRVWYESYKTDNNRIEIFSHDKTRVVIYGENGELKIYRD